MKRGEVVQMEAGRECKGGRGVGEGWRAWEQRWGTKVRRLIRKSLEVLGIVKRGVGHHPKSSPTLQWLAHGSAHHPSMGFKNWVEFFF